MSTEVEEESPTADSYPCPACEITCNNIVSWSEHLQSIEHLQNVIPNYRRLLPKKDGKGNEKDDEGSAQDHSSILEGANLTSCEVCNLKFNSPVQAVQHYSGKKHLNKIGGKKVVKEFESECLPCSKIFVNKDKAREHFDSLLHFLTLCSLDDKNKASENVGDIIFETVPLEDPGKYVGKNEQDRKRKQRGGRRGRKNRKDIPTDSANLQPLSQRVIKKDNAAKCLVCKETFASNAESQQHFLSQRHKDMLSEASKRKNVAQSPSKTHPNSSDRSRTQSNNRNDDGYCSLCRELFSKRDSKQHYESESHKNASNRLGYDNGNVVHGSSRDSRGISGRDSSSGGRNNRGGSGSSNGRSNSSLNTVQPIATLSTSRRPQKKDGLPQPPTNAAVRGYPNEQYTSSSGPVYTGQGYNDQGYTGQVYPGHGSNSQGYPSQGPTSQGYPAQTPAGQDYSDQGSMSQGSLGPISTGQGYSSQNPTGQGYTGQSYTNQGYPPENQTNPNAPGYTRKYQDEHYRDPLPPVQPEQAYHTEPKSAIYGERRSSSSYYNDSVDSTSIDPDRIDPNRQDTNRSSSYPQGNSYAVRREDSKPSASYLPPLSGYAGTSYASRRGVDPPNPLATRDETSYRNCYTAATPATEIATRRPRTESTEYRAAATEPYRTISDPYGATRRGADEQPKKPSDMLLDENWLKTALTSVIEARRAKSGEESQRQSPPPPPIAARRDPEYVKDDSYYDRRPREEVQATSREPDYYERRPRATIDDPYTSAAYARRESEVTAKVDNQLYQRRPSPPPRDQYDSYARRETYEDSSTFRGAPIKRAYEDPYSERDVDGNFGFRRRKYE